MQKIEERHRYPVWPLPRCTPRCCRSSTVAHMLECKTRIQRNTFFYRATPLFSLSLSQILSGGADGLVKLWNVASGECVNTFDQHEDKVRALRRRACGGGHGEEGVGRRARAGARAGARMRVEAPRPARSACSIPRITVFQSVSPTNLIPTTTITNTTITNTTNTTHTMPTPPTPPITHTTGVGAGCGRRAGVAAGLGRRRRAGVPVG